MPMKEREKFRVLIVDDEEANRKLLGELVAMCGYDLQAARDGLEALERVKTFQPDIVLLDVIMPAMDGYEVCRRLKADPQTQGIPVVMITASADQDAKLKGLKAGANDFLNKPVDLSELVARVQNLLALKETVERVNRAKSDFLANMSHELRTPLNAIIGFSEMLRDGFFGELNLKQAEYVNDILSSGCHLLSLINDILDLSKVEAGEMELQPSEVSLRSLLETGLTMVRQKALQHGIALSLEIEEESDTLVADERKVKQIIFNLLSNAVKFTPDGGRVGVEAHREGEWAAVTVWDTGIGIAPEDQKRLFQAFQQIDGSLNRQYEGTGLGLALTKRLVELHGGDIRVVSAPGEGSCFTFTLPLQKVPSSAEVDDLLTYAGFCRQLDYLVDSAKRRGKGLAVIGLRLKGAGEAVVDVVSRSLQSQIRSCDVMGRGQREESFFFLALFDVSLSQAHEVVLRCRALLAEEGIEAEGKVVACPVDGETAEELIGAIGEGREARGERQGTSSL